MTDNPRASEDGRSDELTCRELVELVTDYLEEVLEPAERIRFEQHVVWCGWCSSYLDQMRETIRLSGMLREEDVSPEARDALLAAFRGWRSGAS